LVPLDRRWPFLLRFPVSSFGICLGLGSQSILWKTLAAAALANNNNSNTNNLFISFFTIANLVLWSSTVLALVGVSGTYLCKCWFYMEAVRREYYHPVRVNYFFAPWIAAMFVALGAPPPTHLLKSAAAITSSPGVWAGLAGPILALDLKIYGQWLSGGGRRLSRVANPSTHLAVTGNFVAALLAAQGDGAISALREPAIFFWAVGSVHYLVLLVTLYQRLPFSESVPKDLHPIFFLFVAAPSAASVAWKSVAGRGRFDLVSRAAYFLALFLASSLVCKKLP
jgi:tellurite resistance protein TehA-like permease